MIKTLASFDNSCNFSSYINNAESDKVYIVIGWNCKP